MVKRLQEPPEVDDTERVALEITVYDKVKTRAASEITTRPIDTSQWFVSLSILFLRKVLCFMADYQRKIMNLSEIEKQALTELSRAFRERFDAKEVRLYGSAARDEMDEGSDIDIFLVLPEVTWEVEKEVIKICFDAELKYGRVFSVVCYSVDDIQNSPLKESPLVLNVRKQGRIL